MAKKTKILILEDSPLDVILIERQLKKAKIAFESRAVEDKKGFIDALREFKPDLILADYRLPQFDALSALKIAKKRAWNAPFIIITGSVSEEAAVNCIKQGADDYLLKDRLVRMGEAIRSSLEKKKIWSDRERVLAELRESEEKHRTLFETMAQGVFYLDSDGRTLSSNRAAEMILGLTAEQISGQLLHEFDLRIIREDGSPFPREELPAFVALRTGRKVENVVMGVWNHKKKEHRWIITHAVPMFRLRRKKPYMVYSTFTDVTEIKQAERALRESEERFRMAVNHFPSIFVIYDPERRIQYINAYGLALSGIHREDILGRLDEEIFPEGFTREYLPMLEEAVKTRSTQIAECSMVLRKKTYFMVVSYMPLLDENGEILQILGITYNITSRKAAEEALRQSEERLRLALDAVNDALWDWNIASGQTFLSPRFFSMLGYSSVDIPHHADAWKQLVHPDDRENAIPILQQQGAIESESFEREFRVRAKSGEWQWMLGRGKVIEWDKSGHPQRVIGTCVDISARRKTEDELRSTRELYRTFIDSQSDMAFLKDEKFRYLIANRELCRFFGKGEAEIMERTDFELMDESEASRHRRSDIQALASGEMVVSEEPVGERAVEIRKFSVKMAGGKTGIGGYIRDITQRKISEERIRESLQEKEVLLREIHHRVKNNLQIVSSLLKLQSSHISDPHLQEIIIESQNRIWSMALIHEKLYQSENMARIDLNDYVRSLVTSLFTSYGNPMGTVTMKIEISDIFLSIDKVIPLALIINELVSNILKHAFPDGRKGEFRVIMRSLAPDKTTGNVSKLKLVVSDNGVGLPATVDLDDLKSLGLKLVAILSKQLGGRVSVERKIGTDFCIEFPGGLQAHEAK